MLGEKNFVGNTYRGGMNQQDFINHLEEVFGSENIKDGKYQGEQDTANIHKVFKPENFTNGEYTGGWNKKQDLDNLKGVLGEKNVVEEETNKENIKTIETKLGGAEKFQGGVYQVKTEIVKTVIEELKAGKVILSEIQDIFGKDKFYSNEPGKGVRAGREEQEYKSNVQIAEGVYEQAEIDTEKALGANLTKEETQRIKLSSTKTKLKEKVDPDGLINRDRKIEKYTTKPDVKDKFPDVKGNDLTGELKEIKISYDENRVPDTRNQRIAYDNGWTKPTEIKESKFNYQGEDLFKKPFQINDVEVLKVKKADIDNEIAKVDKLVQKITNFKFLRELDAEQVNIDKTFQELKRELLPANKDQQITDIDGGLDKVELDGILAKMKDKAWDATNYEQANTKIINAFLKADLGIKEMNEKDLDEPNEKLYGKNDDGDPQSWLMSKGGYELPDDIVKFEEKLPTEKRGSSLLKYFYEKSTDRKNRPFDPQKYIHEPDAAQNFFLVKSKEIDVIGGDKGTQGHLAVAAGGGKTTKTMNCMVNGGKEHVILICPTPTLVERTLKEATQQEIDDGYAEDQPVEIYESHGDYPEMWEEMDDKKEKKDFQYFLEEIIKEIKSKLVSKDDTTIVFDEAHYNIGAYQALQLKMVQAGFKVVRMSATFPGVPFSTTSTYPKKSYYSGELDPKMPGFTMKIANEKHAQALAKFRKTDVSTIKWQDEKGQYLPVPVSLDERFRFGKTLIFVRDINITAEQSAVFGTKYSCVAFTPVYKDFCETVSFGRQPGAVMLGNFEHQMGLTFEIDTVISTGLIEVSNLGKNFEYSEKMTQFNPISSDIQEQGRGGRIQNGLWITLTKECQEIIVEEDIEAAMVKACGLAHPHRFGKPPAEILIGLKVDKSEKDRAKRGEPLTKIAWKVEADAKGMFEPDTPKPEMRANDAKELLKELITNFIAKDKNFPKGLNLKSQSNLIGAVYGKALEEEKKIGKQEIAEEMKNVLNGAIEKDIKKFIKDKVYDDNYLRSKDPKVIQDIVNLYRLNNTKVYFTFEENEEKKEV
ncbi:10344_t:CDS:10 [Funneliformis geosporum]|nr:10344_t:CDS:10 [Funneliformis geosporum]